MKSLIFGLALLVSGAARAELVAPTYVKNLTGCFNVAYRFVEDGKHDYEIKDAYEWINLSAKDGVFKVQHYGLFGEEIMKHFYEEWTTLPDGRAEQKIFGPNGGAVRYTCTSAVRNGQLRCDSKGAPKPVRHRKRTEFDKLNRGTTIQVTNLGWVQSEINDLVKNDGTVVATEVGWIEYRRIDDKKCEKAKEQFPSQN